MKMSSKARYGLYAAVELARRYDSGLCPVSEIALTTGVTEKYLEQIFALLKKEGIVVSSRGANGGYVLSCAPEEISVGRVLLAVEDMEIVDCIHGNCENSSKCPSKRLWSRLYANINDYLNTITLKELVEETKDNESIFG